MNSNSVLVLYVFLLLALFNGSLSNVYSPQEAKVLNDAASNAIKDIRKEGHFQTGRKVMESSSFGSFMKGKKNYYYGSSERASKEAEASRRRNLLVFSNREKKVAVAGFVAFNEDYRGPRHHPPKNN